MTALRVVFIALGMLLCAAGIALADGNTGAVYVHVLDAHSGKPSRGWIVQVTGRDGDTSSVSGTSGQATFLAISPGLARIDVMQHGHLGACPAIVVVGANERTVVNVHVSTTRAHQPLGCSPNRSQAIVRPGVTSDVYDIY